MRITKRQLRRIIREASEHAAEARGMAASYQRGYDDGWSTPQSPPTTGRDPEYLRGYKKGAADYEDGAPQIREADGSTKKYDDDSALKGGQSKLPDGLQKGIIDKTVEDREEHEEEEREEKNEYLRITIHQLRRIIGEAFDYPAGYEPTNVDKVYEIIQPLLDESNVGLDRQGEIAMEIADAYALEFDLPAEADSSFLKNEIYAMAEDILKTDAGYYDDEEEDEMRYATGRPWEHN